MDAKQRYRQRLKLQAALTRVVDQLSSNELAGIPADRTTALMAWQVYAKLRVFIKASGIEAVELPDHVDHSRLLQLLITRKRETAKRKIRRLKRTRRR